MNRPSTRREFLKSNGLAAMFAVFAKEGRLSMTNYSTPPKNRQAIEVYAIQGSVRLVSCAIHELRSIWRAS